MPGTTAPECFGLKGREIIQLARTAGTFGADIMEVSELCPKFDVSRIEHQDRGADDHAFPRQQGEDPA